MKVRWSRRAEAHVVAIAAYIAYDNEAAASATYFRIRDRGLQLADHPKLGRAGRLKSTRELVVVGTPYIIVYRLERGMAEILHVIHGAQRWPPKGR